MTIICGIDPGLTGAIAFIDGRGSMLSVHDIPTMPNPDAGPKTTVKREIDVCALSELIRSIVPADESAVCVMEHVSSLGNQIRGSQAIVSLAASKASIMAVFRLLRMDVRRVAPHVWKRDLDLPADKRVALALARHLYPSAPLGLQKHHNRAEALLIAHWAHKELS